jgi:hypothetical protein
MESLSSIGIFTCIFVLNDFGWLISVFSVHYELFKCKQKLQVFFVDFSLDDVLQQDQPVQRLPEPPTIQENARLPLD